jgi:ribosome maturation factor RimP
LRGTDGAKRALKKPAAFRSTTGSSIHTRTSTTGEDKPVLVRTVKAQRTCV